MATAARSPRPSFGLAIILFLVAVDVGAIIQLTELGDAFSRATRHGMDLWVAVGLAGQVLRIAGPLMGTVLVLQRSPRSRAFWMALLAAFAVLAGLHLLTGHPPQPGAIGFTPSVQAAAFDLDPAESLHLLVVSLGWLAFWGTARGARRPFERPAERPAAAGGFGGVAVPRRRFVSPFLVLALLSGGAVMVLLLKAGLSEDPDLLTRIVSSAERKKPAKQEPVVELGQVEPVAVLELPGYMGRILPGGSGRLLVVRLRQSRDLAVFDSGSRTLTTIGLPQANAPVAVGDERVMVFDGDPPVAYVRSLANLGAVQSVPLGPGGAVYLAAMGSHDARRLFLLRQGDHPHLEIRDARDPARVLDPDVDTALAGPSPVAGYMVASPHGDRLQLGRGFCRGRASRAPSARIEPSALRAVIGRNGTRARSPSPAATGARTAAGGLRRPRRRCPASSDAREYGPSRWAVRDAAQAPAPSWNELKK